ncbi:hypothetical protein FACS1894133_3230 [Clostridia bacterium]|nr:hypothetical protein FACS1894133_3230 [Clostridia bacterium]
MNRWHIKSETYPPVAEGVIAACGYAGGAYLYNLGITDSADVVSLTEDFSLYSPLKMRDMSRSAERIAEAIDSGECVYIFGDSDCDGVTATAVLYNCLYRNGADVHYMVTPRTEGYGLTLSACEELIRAKAQLVITVDTGISAYDEAEFITSHGIDLIITDHHVPHAPSGLPNAYAVINPKRDDDEYPYKDLAGCGVAFKLVCALELILGDGVIDMTAVLDEYAPLVAIGTIADCMPLDDENRAIVKYGLSAIEYAGNAGVSAIIRASKLGGERGAVTASDVRFTLAPRINCAGRYDVPLKAVLLFTTDDIDIAGSLAKELADLNDRRRADEADILKQAEGLLTLRGGGVYTVYFGDVGEKRGVMGSVASKLSARTGASVILLYESGGSIVLSARSQKGTNIRDILERVSGTSGALTRFGGHDNAAGGTLAAATPDDFYKALGGVIDTGGTCEASAYKFPTMDIECVLPAAGLMRGDLCKIHEVEPFRAGTPRFLLPGCVITAKFPIKNGQYVSVCITYGGEAFRLVSFIHTYEQFWYKAGDKADIIVEAGSQSPLIQDIRLSRIFSGENNDKFLNALETYENYKRGIPFPEKLLPRVTPNESHFRAAQVFADSSRDEALQKLYLLGLNACVMSLAYDTLEQQACGLTQIAR